MSSKNVKKLKAKSEVEIKCKTEKVDELHSLEFYIDDRLELIKQIFSSLKPKTIKSLAPEFLKESDIDEIEELCLNELLGISTKRLRSIISAADCPSNTESLDSDVENIEENISLEEISSDSNNELDGKTKKKYDSKRQKKIGKDQREDNNLNENGKEISVLELLELQARARAIRSQLALEPIAKIEVDSEASDKEAIKVAKPSEAKVKGNIAEEHSASTSNNKSSKLTKDDNKNLFPDVSLPNGSVDTNTEGTKKRIKLKRNFRKRSTDFNNEKDQDNQPSSCLKPVNETEFEEIKKSPKERSPSPDVFPIITSPEILCISDSSDDEKKKLRKTQETTEYENEKQTNEDKSVSTKEDGDNNNSKDSDEISETEANNNSKDSNEEGEISEAEPNSNSKDSYEEGEISGTEVSQDNKTIENAETSSIQTNKNEVTISEPEVDISAEIKNVDHSSPITEKSETEKDQSNKNPEFVISSEDENNDNSINIKTIEENQSDKQENDSDKNNESDTKQIKESSHEILSSDDEKSNEKNYDSNDQNDDIISLNDDEDIELALEQKKCSENQRIKKEEDMNVKLSKVKKLRHKIKKANEEDESSGSSTDDEKYEKTKNEDESTSWNTRWLRSSKVSKIMATSKLGNRLREKILKRKKAREMEKQQSIEDIDATTANDSPKSNSNFEDGSVQQYSELDRTKKLI